MSAITVTSALVGKSVRNAARPEWGNGTVLTVAATSVGGSPAYRVSIQFAAGHRTLLVPPARLVAPEQLSAEERPAGWIERISGTTVDDRLRNLPLAVTELLGTLAQRVAALAPLYEIDAQDQRGLLRWARAQTGVVDPLTRWTRDELERAFIEFARNRDDELRGILAAAKFAAASGGDHEVVRDALTPLPERIRARMLEVLRRPL